MSASFNAFWAQLRGSIPFAFLIPFSLYENPYSPCNRLHAHNPVPALGPLAQPGVAGIDTVAGAGNLNHLICLLFTPKWLS